MANPNDELLDFIFVLILDQEKSK